MPSKYSANQVRQEFIDFFVKKKGHTFVPSSPLVPGDDATLLFTNSGMVQFKDVFLGTDRRPYTRAANSQKCMRVAGKHNDLEDVGFDDTHHTFFEMLGSWSFGDYYKKEAIDWAWELLTEIWKLPKERLYVTVFKDELGEIPTDEEAVEAWKSQPGLDHEHIVYLGRKDNFWEMADTGPCGPNSEIMFDLGEERGEITYREDGQVDLDGPRFVELWNLVFIQFNRSGPNDLEPLPATHVDTGMGFERIVSILQGKNSNYRTDLFGAIIDKIQALAKHSDKERDKNFTPYRVIADHSRAATFLIADGVVPGNLGRNYVTRMIIRRAARFGGKIGLNEPFLAPIAETIIAQYGEAYPELVKNRKTILENLTKEEERFLRTVESGVANLETLFEEMARANQKIVPGEKALDLYTTYGLPLEITRDIARERGLEVDEEGFQRGMEEHRIASGAGQAMGELGGEKAKAYKEILEKLQKDNSVPKEGVVYNPYDALEVEGELLAILKDGEPVKEAKSGERVELVLPETCFYVASGGQIADTGTIVSAKEPRWEVEVTDTYRPAAGVIAHIGEVVKGKPKIGDQALAAVDRNRRQAIMRNHTATHLLHAELHAVLGEHARQAGSLVAPDRLRFDFTHSEALTEEELARIEQGVNRRILENHILDIEFKPLEQAKAEGAIALFGEKYGDTVRTVAIGAIGEGAPFSYELCGGTHVRQTGDIGTFLIISEGSAAAGIRRIEAITGQAAYELIQARLQTVKDVAAMLKVTPDQIDKKVGLLMKEAEGAQKEIQQLRNQIAHGDFSAVLQNVPKVNGVAVLSTKLPGANMDMLRQMADRFKQTYDSGVAVLAGLENGSPQLVAAVTDDLIKRGLHAGELVKFVAEPLGGSGGGRANMAQAGGKDAGKLDEALASVPEWVEKNLQPEK
jgi:alanyl-tRNA synthetase